MSSKGQSKIAATWSKIEKWLDENAPASLASLQPPASAEPIADLEKQLGLPLAGPGGKLPGELKESLLVHNGAKAEGSAFWGLVEGWMLLSCEGIASWWRTMAELQDGGDFNDCEAEGDGEVKSDWWNRRWIPILEGPGGDLLCIDMDPDECGTEGQVIRFLHDEPDREVCETSLESLLRKFVVDLENGDYMVTRKGSLSVRL